MDTALATQPAAAIAPAQNADNSPMALLRMAIESGASHEAIERVAALAERMERFEWERAERQALIDFDDALNRCQKLIESVPATRKSDKGRYANYDDLDAVVRPIYTAEGFSISYGEADCPTPGKTRFVAYLRRSGITREYFKDMTASTKGPKGNDVLTQIHAEASADSYAKRYLLKDIFNISIGENDDDGNGGLPEWVIDHLNSIDSSEDVYVLRERFQSAYKVAQKKGDRKAMGEIIFCRDRRAAVLKGGAQ